MDLKTNGLAGAVILLLSVGVVAQEGPLRNLQILGPAEITPDEFAEYQIVWEGGQRPFEVVLEWGDPPFNRQEVFSDASISCAPVVFDSGCGTTPITEPYAIPRLAKMKARVVDGVGASVERQRNVRVGTDGPIYSRGLRLNIRDDPGSDRFLCQSESDEDPLFLNPSLDETGDGVQFNWPTGTGLPPPVYLEVFENSPEGFPVGLAYAVEHIDFESACPSIASDGWLDFPVFYGDYSDPETKIRNNAANPSPPLKPLYRYSVQANLFCQCNDVSSVSHPFWLNPPDIGDVVVGSIAQCTEGRETCSQTIVDDTDVSETFLDVLQRREISRLNNLFAGCMKESYEEVAFFFLSKIASSDEVGQVPDDFSIPASIVLFFLNSRDEIRQWCLEGLLVRGGTGIPILPLELDIDDGRVRIDVVVPSLESTVRLDRAVVTTLGQVSFVAGQKPGGEGLVVPIDQALVVVVDNGNQTELTVEPGFFLTVAPDGSFELRSDQLFLDRFVEMPAAQNESMAK